MVQSASTTASRPLSNRFWPALALLLLLGLPLATGCTIRDLTEPEPGVGDDPVVPETPGDPVDEPRDADHEVVLGHDYRLPEWVTPEDFAGYVDHPDYADYGEGTAYRNWWTSWAQLEPERGQYDWDLLESKLDAAAAAGYRLCPQIRNLVCGGGNDGRGVEIPSAVPAWVFEEFDLDEDDIVALGGDWNLQVIPAWRHDLSEAFNDFIRAMGERGYPAREEFGALYIHGISNSRGEEFRLEPFQTEILENRAGFSAEVMETWLAGRMDAHAQAFGAEARKLAWVGQVGIWGYSGQDYADAAWNLVQHAWSLGIGNRASIVEKYHVSLDEPSLGQSVDDQGYLYTDETIAPIANGLYFGDENEEYGDDWTWRYGSRAGDWQRYRFAMLRAMQMQVRHLWTRPTHAEAIDPELSLYARRSFGKSVTTSPDAWSYLKESAISSSVCPAGVVKNFERWLVQRDVPGGLTVPAEPVEREFNAGGISDGSPGAFLDHAARRTDHANGQPFIYFDLDDRFATPGEVQIKVEVLDDTAAVWRLEYVGADGSLVATDDVTGQGDGATRTVTFTLDNARFQNGLDHGMDFRIVCNGPADVTVRWVRLVRTSRP